MELLWAELPVSIGQACPRKLWGQLAAFWGDCKDGACCLEGAGWPFHVQVETSQVVVSVGLLPPPQDWVRCHPAGGVIL